MAEKLEKIKKWKISENHISGVVYKASESGKKKIFISGNVSYQRGDIVEIGTERTLVPLKRYKLS